MKDADSHTHRLVQPSTVDELFGRLGAKPEAVDVGKPAVPEPMQIICKWIVPSMLPPSPSPPPSTLPSEHADACSGGRL